MPPRFERVQFQRPGDPVPACGHGPMEPAGTPLWDTVPVSGEEVSGLVAFYQCAGQPPCGHYAKRMLAGHEDQLDLGGE